MQSSASAPTTISITFNNETVVTTSDKFREATDALVARHPGVKGVPRVQVVSSTLTVPANPSPVSSSTPVRVQPAATPAVVRGTTVDAAGAVRSDRDRLAAAAAGFAPKQPLYTAGTMVLDIGVENARQSRMDFDAKPLVSEYCADFEAQIQAEQRHDMLVRARDVRMGTNGLLELPGRRSPLALTTNAIPGLAYNLDIQSGGTFLQKAPADIRSVNVNYFAARLHEAEEAAKVRYQHQLANWRLNGSRRDEKPEEPTPSQFKLRVRRNANAMGGEEAFAAVGPKYGAFDVDKIAAAIRMAAHPEARGSVTYDGEKARFEILFHTNTKPEDFVAGEFFRGGMIIKTDDTGGGSIRGSSMVEQNLCLNLIILDKAVKDVFRIRHIGDVRRMAQEFKVGFAQAQASLEHFLKVWGYAVHDDLAQPGHLVKATDEAFPSVREIMIAGIMHGILKEELVPVRGWRKKDAVPLLVKAWQDDESAAGLAHDGINRGAIVNAFTRFAHEQPQEDPWVADEIQEAASSLLFGKWRKDGTQAPPPPLPYQEFDGDLVVAGRKLI